MNTVPFALAVLLAMAASARAEEPGVIKVVVRVAPGGDDRELLARVEGQTSDLPVELIVDRGKLERTGKARRRAAVRLAREHGARAVVWFEPLGGRGWRVQVADVDEKRLLSREIEGNPRGRDRSALLEAAAQVVRSALQSIEQGEPIGEQAELEPPDTEEPPPPRPPPPPPRPPRRARPWYHVRGMLGGAVVFDGSRDDGSRVLTSRLAVPLGRFDAFLALDHFLAYETLDDPQDGVSFELGRGLIAAGVRYHIIEPVAVALRGGVVVYGRKTTQVTAPAVPTDDVLLFAGFGGPELSFTWRPVPHVGVELTLGMDVVAGAPELGVERQGTFVSIRELWTIQPHAGLGLVFE